MLKKRFILAALSAMTALRGAPAHASDAEWVKPGTDLIATLESGFVQLGAGALGVAIIIYGLYTTFTGEPNWKRLAGMVFGGACVFFGPDILIALLKAKGGS
ncbi:MAG: TrbC/VirB2 family protein [Methylocystaceae bacterium]|nr:TrbC/VirB2 family protein [Methylocystaceae bacterium]